MAFFESQHVRVERVSAFNSDIVVVSFAERSDPPVGFQAQGFGQDFARKLSLDGFYIKCIGNHWYQYPEMPDAMEAIRRATMGKTLVTYGSSMGAYAAIKFAKLLGAKRAVAISPLFSPDPRQPPFELRWRVDVDRTEMINDLMEDADVDVFVLTDPVHADAKHARLFRQRFTRCKVIAAPFAAHPVGHFLREAGLLADLMSSLLLGKFENSSWCTARRGARTKSAIYNKNLTDTLKRRQNHPGSVSVGVSRP